MFSILFGFTVPFPLVLEQGHHWWIDCGAKKWQVYVQLLGFRVDLCYLPD